MTAVARLNEETYTRNGDRIRSWDERWGDFVLNVTERDYDDSLYGPGQTQSVEVTRLGAPTRLFTVSSIAATGYPEAERSARDQAIDWMRKQMKAEKE